ncbi:MAG: ABC transporter substrate-binding protein [Hydrogenophaga sp.]|uniref:ABC transporter substrate-binding protein n=1 Tax=Hydrogenophaga sp. TaxID=1904254 RepID=UPI00168DA5DB|nr:ABC transporter substrate-binding protein [Hydrogenophaga sp.]NIM43833.1 ABC transporter substrate-binding protein [Hydrogenophaga sp.]NIN28899.1 ABC transporter substrate-binding protein [Hydrogenophaga sp.]NIN33358.1 ABC transporter substrate-binding protein [Hydrogenophaga sp.]NIN58033.1 ABC transporter substrate-binding protein [Hydrogenophaga sp.]NIO54331.1 ABC transporter substrate-binding protein [Hydrogenophaga sp.]
MNRRLTALALGLLAAGATFNAAAQQQGVSDTEIVIGDILPLTGPPALLGVAHNLGVKAAVAEANAAGGIHGRKLRLISEDDGYVPSRTIQGVRKLINSDKIFAFTSISGTAQAQAAMPLIKQTGIPAMAPITTYEGLYQPTIKNVFAVGYDMREAVYELVSKMAERYPNKKWAVISQDDDYGQNVRDGFERAAKEKKLQVVSSQIYKKGQSDFSSEILKVKQAGAEALMAGGVLGENVTMTKELERIGHKIPVGVTYVSRVPASAKMMGSAGETVYTVDYVYLESSPEAKGFMDKLEKHLSAEERARVNRYTFTGYSAARALFAAMDKCGKALTWDCTNAELAKLKNLETGAMTPISFAADDHLAAPKLFLLKADPAATTYKLVQ